MGYIPGIDAGTLKRSLPQSDYDIALEELNKEFPGAVCEPMDIEKAPSDLFTKTAILGMGLLMFLFFVIIF